MNDLYKVKIVLSGNEIEEITVKTEANDYGEAVNKAIAALDRPTELMSSIKVKCLSD